MTKAAKRLMQADNCVLVFVNPQTAHEGQVQQGVFYDFVAGQLYQLDLKTTILGDLVHAENVGSVTFPMLQQDDLEAHTDLFEGIMG